MFPNVQTIRLLEAARCDFNKVVLRHGCSIEKIISKKKLKKNKKKIQKKNQLKLQWGYAFGTLVFQNH